jgi:DNA-binding protein H-NS
VLCETLKLRRHRILACQLKLLDAFPINPRGWQSTAYGEAVRQIRQTKQEEARHTTRQAIEARLQATGLSLRDLFPELLPGRRSGETGSLPPKYRGPNGEEWSGRGHTPKWLTALEATGRSRDEFRIREETRQDRTLSAATIEDI